MNSAAALRSQIEAALADRIPSALTPAAKTNREVMPTGIVAIDAVLDGGLPVGAVTEMIGAECSGRTALALSFLAQLTKAERVCEWIDVSNALSPESAAASGIDLKRLLWVRCTYSPPVNRRPLLKVTTRYLRSTLPLPQRREGCTAVALARIFGLEQRAYPVESTTCCDDYAVALGRNLLHR